MSIFVCVEGPDGTGKTTLADSLMEVLDGNWKRFYQPFNKDYIDKIKESFAEKDVEKQIFWFMKDRLEMLSEVQACLDSGVNVLMDRYYHSTCVYQYACQKGESLESGFYAHKGIVQVPDVTLLLTCSSDVQTERLGARLEVDNLSEFEKNLDFRKKVIDKYNTMLKLEEFKECVEINTSDRTMDQVLNEALEIVRLHQPYKSDYSS